MKLPSGTIGDFLKLYTNAWKDEATIQAILVLASEDSYASAALGKTAQAFTGRHERGSKYSMSLPIPSELKICVRDPSNAISEEGDCMLVRVTAAGHLTHRIPQQ